MSAPQRGFKLGEILVQDGIITEAQLEEALKMQRVSGVFLGDSLIQKGWLTEVQLLGGLSKQFQMPYVQLDFEEIDWAVPRKYPTVLAPGHYCFPYRQDASSVTVAIANPLEMWGVSHVEEQSRGRQVHVVLATKSAIRRAVEEFRHRAIHGDAGADQ